MCRRAGGGPPLYNPPPPPGYVIKKSARRYDLSAVRSNFGSWPRAGGKKTHCRPTSAVPDLVVEGPGAGGPGVIFEGSRPIATGDAAFRGDGRARSCSRYTRRSVPG